LSYRILRVIERLIRDIEGSFNGGVIVEVEIGHAPFGTAINYYMPILWYIFDKGPVLVVG